MAATRRTLTVRRRGPSRLRSPRRSSPRRPATATSTPCERSSPPPECSGTAARDEAREQHLDKLAARPPRPSRHAAPRPRGLPAADAADPRGRAPRRCCGGSPTRSRRRSARALLRRRPRRRRRPRAPRCTRSTSPRTPPTATTHAAPEDDTANPVLVVAVPTPDPTAPAINGVRQGDVVQGRGERTRRRVLTGPDADGRVRLSDRRDGGALFAGRFVPAEQLGTVYTVVPSSDRTEAAAR